MKIRWNKWNRLFHYWGAGACALPLLVVIITGVLLLLKKESDWIQPPTQRGSSGAPSVSFETILTTVQGVPETEVEEWGDIKLLDVRPDKGVVKVRSRNNWEVQLDMVTGEVLQTAYRRSDTIESLHDGSFFHDKAKLWVFLPSAIILLLLWVTGIYLFVVTWLRRNSRGKRNTANN